MDDSFRFSNALPKRTAIRREPAIAPIIGRNISSTLHQFGLMSLLKSEESIGSKDVTVTCETTCD